MSSSGLCFLFGFSSGFICRLIMGKKYDSSNRPGRIHQIQTEYNREMFTNNNLTITQQPQQAIRYNGELSLPTAQAHVVRDT